MRGCSDRWPQCPSWSWSGRSRGRASEEGPEEEGSPEQDDVTEVNVAGVILDLDSIEVAAVAEAEIAAAAAAEADCDAESDGEDELDETQTVVDESCAELPSDELSMNDASDAMAALDVSLMQDLGGMDEGEGVGPAGDDGFELFDIEQAHEELRSAELGVSASFQKERAESVASEAEAQQASAEFLSRRSCVLWGEAAVPALELLHRIQEHNEEYSIPERGNLALCLRRFGPTDEEDRKLGAGDFSETVCWLLLDGVADSCRGRMTKVAPSTGRIEFGPMGPHTNSNSKVWTKHFDDSRLQFLIGNCGVGMFRGGGGLRNFVKSDIVEFSNFYGRLLVCATVSASVDLVCTLCSKPMAQTCALCALHWHPACATSLSSSSAFRDFVSDLSHGENSEVLASGAASIDFPPGSCCIMCARILDLIS